jgi:BioD-like phosphotransacetylase family protein
VKPEKYEQTKHYLSLALERYWGPDIPVLACIPDRPFLGCPALADLERLLNASLVSGTQHRLRHYRVQDLTMVGKSLEAFLKDLREKRNAGGRTLYVCHASRNDILLGYLMESVNRAYFGRNDDDPNHSWETAMLVTGCDDYPISTQILEIITSLKNAPPVLLTNAHTDHAMHAIYGFTPKLNSEDGNRVAIAVQHYEPYIDFDKLLERVDLGTNLQVAQA